jgi:transformer-2 protein
VKIVKDPFTKESRGFAFITYEKNSQALESIKQMNGQEFSGRQIAVEISKRNKERTSTPGIYLGPSSAKRMRPKYDNYRNSRSYRSRSRSIHDKPRNYNRDYPDKQDRPKRFSRSRSNSFRKR